MNNASNLVRKITVRKTSLRNVGIARVIVGALWLLSIPATAGMLYYAYQSSIWHSQVAVASSMHIFMMVVVALTPIMLGVLSWIFSRLDSFISGKAVGAKTIVDTLIVLFVVSSLTATFFSILHISNGERYNGYTSFNTTWSCSEKVCSRETWGTEWRKPTLSIPAKYAHTKIIDLPNAVPGYAQAANMVDLPWNSSGSVTYGETTLTWNPMIAE